MTTEKQENKVVSCKVKFGSTTALYTYKVETKLKPAVGKKAVVGSKSGLVEVEIREVLDHVEQTTFEQKFIPWVGDFGSLIEAAHKSLEQA